MTDQEQQLPPMVMQSRHEQWRWHCAECYVSGKNYRTREAASKAANKHMDQQHGFPVRNARVVGRLPEGEVAPISDEDKTRVLQRIEREREGRLSPPPCPACNGWHRQDCIDAILAAGQHGTLKSNQEEQP